MARVSPLAVAAVSGILLMVVLGVDATVNRSYAVDVEGTGGWQTVAQGPVQDEYAFVRYPFATGAVEVEDNASVTFRVRGENGYPWAMSERYTVYGSGAVVAEGILTAPARGSGESEFTLDVARLASGPYGQPKLAGDPADRIYLELRVGGETLYGEVAVREAGA
jgi:hypothetical protein